MRVRSIRVLAELLSLVNSTRFATESRLSFWDWSWTRSGAQTVCGHHVFGTELEDAERLDFASYGFRPETYCYPGKFKALPMHPMTLAQ